MILAYHRFLFSMHSFKQLILNFLVGKGWGARKGENIPCFLWGFSQVMTPGSRLTSPRVCLSNVSIIMQNVQSSLCGDVTLLGCNPGFSPTNSTALCILLSLLIYPFEIRIKTSIYCIQLFELLDNIVCAKCLAYYLAHTDKERQLIILFI